MSGEKPHRVKTVEFLDDGTVLVHFSKPIPGQGEIKIVALAPELILALGEEHGHVDDEEPDLEGCVLVEEEDVFGDGDEPEEEEPPTVSGAVREALKDEGDILDVESEIKGE